MADCQDTNNGCELHQFLRNNYFYGKLMTVRDFEDEQSYINDKRHLHGRLLHGFGIVCGLDGFSVTDGGGAISIVFPTGGTALDCCGREIVVPGGSTKKIINEKTASALTKVEVTGKLYLYLKYKPCYGEMVHSASNPSSCDETCCPNRIIEDFDVIASSSAPIVSAVHCPDLPDEPSADAAKSAIKVWFADAIRKCPECDDAKVFVAAVNGDLTPDADETSKYISFVGSSHAIADLLACHMSDFNNPHKTNAQQVGAIASIDGVHNDGGDVDLVQANSITITPNDTSNTITIGETHSGTHGNPHQTKHGELDDVFPIDPEAPIIIKDKRDKHISNADARKWNNAVYKINDADPDNSGKITIAAGSNISIAQTANALTISSSGGGGGECLSGKFIFRDVAAGKSKTSSPIKLSSQRELGVILGVLLEYSLSNSNYKVLITGDSLMTASIRLSAYQDLINDQFVVELVNMSDSDIKSLTVVWWAVAPTKDMGSVVVTDSIISKEHLVSIIAMNPNVSVKTLMAEHGLAAEEINNLISPLIENGQIRSTGTGANRKLVINI